MSIRVLAVAALLSLVACASAPEPRAIEAGEPVTVFTNVTVVTEYGGDRLEHHSVAVRGDRIIAVAPDGGLVLPEGTHTIDGEGRLLAPGIADMHVHYVDPTAGGLFLANSITTVRNPSGGEGVPELIAAIASGARPGPRMYSSGQLIDGPGSFWGPQVVVDTVEGVRERVRADAAAGYMAIKLYSRLTPEQFRAGVEEARAHNLQVYAHVPGSMTLEEVLALQVDNIEHLDGFERSLGGEGARLAQLWASVAPDRYAPLAAEVVESGVWNTPTLIVMLAPARAFVDLAAADAAPEMRYASAGLLQFWHSYARFFPADADLAGRYRIVQQGHANRIAMLAALREAGAPVLIGTDTPNPYVLYGFSIHEELGFFLEAGYTRSEALRIATLEAARFLDQSGEFGVIAEGARADLLLLDGDPEADFTTLRTPAGVMAAGRWYDRAALDGLLEDVEAAAAEPWPSMPQ